NGQRRTVFCFPLKNTPQIRNTCHRCLRGGSLVCAACIDGNIRAVSHLCCFYCVDFLCTCGRDPLYLSQALARRRAALSCSRVSVYSVAVHNCGLDAGEHHVCDAARARRDWSKYCLSWRACLCLLETHS